MTRSEDCKEGLKALLEKRAPRFGGRERTRKTGRAAGLLVERLLELAVRMANCQHRAMRFAHRTFRYAAHQNVSQSRAPVRPQHDKVGAFVDRGVDNLKKWRADAQETARLESVLAQAAGYLVEFADGQQALLLGDAIHRSGVETGVEFGDHHGRQRLIDVDHDDFRGELSREFFSEGECVARIRGEIGGGDNFRECRHVANDTPGTNRLQAWQAVSEEAATAFPSAFACSVGAGTRDASRGCHPATRKPLTPMP